MLVWYIKSHQVAEFEAEGWTVQPFWPHHARYFLAYRDDTA